MKQKMMLLALLMFSFIGYSQIDEVVIDPPSREEYKPEEFAEDYVFNTASVDIKPEYPEEISAFNEFVKANFKKSNDFPEGLRGKILTYFVVEKDGSLSNVEIIADIGYGTKEEAIRVLNLSKKWKQGFREGKPVRVRYSYSFTVN